MMEPTPNLLAQSRLHLDDALDHEPMGGWFSRLRSGFFHWMGHVQAAPALATLLVGLGFLGGNLLTRYQVANAPKLPTPVTVTDATQGSIANISGVVKTPNSDIVQVTYNRVVPERVQGSLDDPQIRQLLTMGTQMPTVSASNDVRTESVALLAAACKDGHACDTEDGGQNVRNALLVSLRYDKDPSVRQKALEGLQPYVAQDQRVRDAVLETLMHDASAGVRRQAVSMLSPVQADSSVREVLRTVSREDDNPYIRTASYQALQGTADIQ
jgi:hypothetical protein